ncbi:MAG: hypothetical protein R2875_03575 [Desulfobacterales bacterium]
MTVRKSHPVYYTRVRGIKYRNHRSICGKKVHSAVVRFGRLKVTDQVTGYEKIHIYGKNGSISRPLIYHRRFLKQTAFGSKFRGRYSGRGKETRFYGVHHAMEHAMIGVCPLLVLTDRNDFGGISTPFIHR